MADQEVIEMPDFRAQFEADRVNVMEDEEEQEEVENAMLRPEPPVQGNGRICEERQMLFMMFRRHVWRAAQNAGYVGGEFPQNLELGQIPEAAQQYLIAAFNRQKINSPGRCIRLARQLRLLPIQVCDFFLNQYYPTLQEDLAARAQRRTRNQRRQRTYIFNVYVSFKVQVRRRGAEAGVVQIQ